MTTKTLYKYKREDGGITVSPIKPDCECEQLLRLIADEGKILTEGDTFAYCIDVDTAEGWTEVDAPKMEQTTPMFKEGYSEQ